MVAEHNKLLLKLQEQIETLTQSISFKDAHIQILKEGRNALQKERFDLEMKLDGKDVDLAKQVHCTALWKDRAGRYNEELKKLRGTS